MTGNDSDRITSHFAATSRDLTPTCAHHTAHVLFAPMSRDPELSRRCASVLSNSEKRRADRFAADNDRAHFEQRRAFRRFCGAAALGSSTPLSDFHFHVTASGRPYLLEVPDLRFSFSCCRFGMLGAWSSTHGVGVDIEDRTMEVEVVEMARRYFAADEAKAVEASSGRERLRVFYRFWSLKEAALKSIGEGLPFGLDAFAFELHPTSRVIHAPAGHGGADRFAAWVIEERERYAAVVVHSPACCRGRR